MYCFVSFIALDLNLSGKWAHFESVIISLLGVAWLRSFFRLRYQNKLEMSALCFVLLLFLLLEIFLFKFLELLIPKVT